MRQLALAAGALCAAAGLTVHAGAQNAAMPGQQVGTGFSFPQAGNAVPKAAPKAGQSIGSPFTNPMMRPYDPNRPYDAFKGTNIDPSTVVAPVPTLGGKNSFSQFYEKMKISLGMSKPVGPTVRTTYTPGISRRNRERAEERLWRRD